MHIRSIDTAGSETGKAAIATLAAGPTVQCPPAEGGSKTVHVWL